MELWVKIPELTRRHVDMDEARRHPKYGSYANSDLFQGILGRIKREKLGEHKWLKLHEIPEGVTVDTSGFLFVVTFKA